MKNLTNLTANIQFCNVNVKHRIRTFKIQNFLFLSLSEAFENLFRHCFFDSPIYLDNKWEDKEGLIAEALDPPRVNRPTTHF